MTTTAWRSAGIAIAALAIAALPARAVRAYERSTVEDDPSTPLAWSQRELPIRVAYDSSGDLAAIDVRDAVARSLATWSGAGSCTDIQLVDAGDAMTLETNLMGGMHDGANVVIFREEGWPADLGPETLAITTLVYRRSTGEIVDADIDVNGVDYTWSVAAVPALDATDLENTMTHEVGHLLGFAHVEEVEATMFAQSDPGDVAKRDLSSDDLRAVCEVYPFGAPTPGRGGNRPPLTSGCATVHVRGSAPLGLIAIVIALAISARRRRARRSS